MTSDRAQWRGAESLMQSAQRRPRSCQVSEATLKSHDPCSRESVIDSGFGAISEQLLGIIGTLITSQHQQACRTR